MILEERNECYDEVYAMLDLALKFSKLDNKTAERKQLDAISSLIYDYRCGLEPVKSND